MSAAFSDALQAGWAARLDPTGLPEWATPASLRRPVHSVYGGAQLFRSDVGAKLGELGRRSVAQFAAAQADWAKELGVTGDDSYIAALLGRVSDKLQREAVEDYRIDFEDGYGLRSSEEEDADARAAGEAVARGIAAGSLPPFLGIRLKPFSRDVVSRCSRTLGLFLAGVGDAAERLPEPFLITLPKVRTASEVSVLTDMLGAAERAFGLREGQLAIELMIETAACFAQTDEPSTLSAWVEAAGGRCKALHLGTYDYLSEHGVMASCQTVDHPLAVQAKLWMLSWQARTGSDIWISDGATTELPVAPHRDPKGAKLSDGQRLANEKAVRKAWALHARNLRHTLSLGLVQSWDLHPAQLPVRYLVLYDFFRRDLSTIGHRLRSFVAQAAHARRLGTTFDDAATARGLINHLVAAHNCGAVSADEVTDVCGMTLEPIL